MSETYTVRPYESTDERAFLSLFEQVLGGRMGEEWFDWKYRSNPYVDHVPIFLAETDDEVVGARAFFPLELRADGAEYLAFQPCDTMVAPDHQRRGLFTRMTEAAVDRYADDVDCFFNFPNDLSLPGNLKLGWEIVGEQATYYRVQNPAAWLSDAVPLESAGRLAEPLKSAGGFAARSYLSVRDWQASSAGEFARRWHDGVPPELLASLADAGTPRRFHVARDETFYRWRFDNPRWTYETVVARDDGPAAAIVVASRTRRDGATLARLADVVPLVGGADRERALSALLPAVLRRHADADVILAPGDSLPSSLLSAHGFHSDRRPPLSWVASPTVQVARPVEEQGDWTLRDRALTDHRNWRLALCERDGG
ncbi:GNAT family N-acetyltransferase [Halorussus salinisoli]|uniref:GNAT family N-acetyltransferase n=1 Tax=Halorussus salinisoli TaxID=2558242 RepID=UPI0010C2182C|nr:GNAT family N-acetyltransferase [Halorussus salinisoli]